MEWHGKWHCLWHDMTWHGMAAWHSMLRDTCTFITSLYKCAISGTKIKPLPSAPLAFGSAMRPLRSTRAAPGSMPQMTQRWPCGAGEAPGLIRHSLQNCSHSCSNALTVDLSCPCGVRVLVSYHTNKSPVRGTATPGKNALWPAGCPYLRLTLPPARLGVRASHAPRRDSISAQKSNAFAFRLRPGPEWAPKPAGRGAVVRRRRRRRHSMLPEAAAAAPVSGGGSTGCSETRTVAPNSHVAFHSPCCMQWGG
eukprot:365763-Chlamydomonas_euryale.AAC.31